MTVKYLKNGYVKLTAPDGLVDKYGNWYSEVTCKQSKMAQYFAVEEAETEEE